MLKRFLIGLCLLGVVGCGSDETALTLTPPGVQQATFSRQALHAQHVQLLAEHHRRVTEALLRLSGRPAGPEVQATVQSLQAIQGRLATEMAGMPRHTALLNLQGGQSSYAQQIQQLRALLASLEQQLQDAQATFDEQERQFGTRIRNLTAALQQPGLDENSRDDLLTALTEVDQAEQDYRDLAVHRIQLIKQQIADTEQDIVNLETSQE